MISNAIASYKRLGNEYKWWNWNLIKRINPKLKGWYDI